MQLNVKDDILKVLRRVAAQQGRSDEEVLEDAIRLYAAAPQRSKSIEDLLERIDRRQKIYGVEQLSEEEAMKLAVEEQRAWRRERNERAG